jgi:Gram-negative bacterial TonB protein C-terminal
MYVGQKKPLQFLVKRESSLLSWWRSLKVLCSRTNSYSTQNSIYLFRSTPVARFELAGRSLTASFLLHCSMILLLLYLPQALPTKASSLVARTHQREKIYFRVPLLDSKKTLPRIAPAGPGGRPGSGHLPNQLPKLGSTAAYGRLTIVSRPAHPDNFRQTILQSFSPPEVKINSDVNVPNILLGNTPNIPKPTFKFNPSDAKPVRANRQNSSDEAPSLAPAKPNASLITFDEPSNSQPRFPVPTASASAAMARRSNDAGEVPAPADPAAGFPGEGYGLVAIGVGPLDSSSEIVLPPGNRWGEFSISPAGGQPGSPGGSTNGVAGGGSGDSSGNGSGGDGSTGVGPGAGGGGGGNKGAGGVLSISGAGTSGEGHGMLDPSLAPSMVYPVSADFSLKVRKNQLVVSAGPVGGGGLSIYGALQCGKIYTVFLAMPGKNWTLQYCQQRTSAVKPAPESHSTVIHLESALLPPDAEARYDFQRLPVPREKAHKLIILKGIIREDGTVDEVQVYQSIVPQMDEAARLALSRWKFKPALRAGKPVTLEILVGIPPEIPSTP